ncbi:hypothetical protein GCM10027276_03820 [Comamonas piscis]
MNISEIANFSVAGATLILAVVTWLSLRETRKTVNAMKRQAEESIRPRIVVRPSVKTNSSIIFLTILNEGFSPAEYLKLTMDKKFYMNGQLSDNIQDYPAFSQVIKSLSGKQELSYILGSGHVILNSPNCPMHFSIKAKYSFNGKSYQDDIYIDLNPFARALAPTSVTAKSMDNLAASIEKLASSINEK